MKIPKYMKVANNRAVVFENYFSAPNGIKCNAVALKDDGTLLFFDTENMHISGTVEVAYEKVKGQLCDENTTF